jgi:hypothetical protein
MLLGRHGATGSEADSSVSSSDVGAPSQSLVVMQANAPACTAKLARGVAAFPPCRGRDQSQVVKRCG